ncbi:MAG: glycosyltransferase family 39 protein [Elusimicrobia bacterium]|nr:glycosyltransferase family 39 protein [Elusimicrobiota bacterium]
MRDARRREAAVAAGFAVLVLFLFSAKPFHMDEPFFLAIARHILQDPLHPFAFDYNWYGSRVPMSAINNTPPLVDYLLAAGWSLSGGREWLTRIFFLPWDIAAAVSLYYIAARFLSRPLWPVLIVIASPAYMINLNHVMPERLVAGFAFPCLWFLIRAVDQARPALFWLSAACFAGALLSKYGAVFLVLPVLAYARERGVSSRRQAAYFAVGFGALLAYLAWQALCGGRAANAVWAVTSQSSAMFWSSWPHKLRSFLAFTAGCGATAIFWPYLAYPRRSLPAIAAAAAGALFVPGLDLAPLVRPIDRWTGLVLACGAAWGLAGLFADARKPGWKLWAPWIMSVALVQLCLYWSIMARLILFLVPPLTFGLAETLEARRRPLPAGLYPLTLAATLALSLALAQVDYRYAAAQKQAAGQIARQYLAAGRRVWCIPHWGLQHYLEAAGAIEMDFSRGGWDLVRPGDVVVLTRVNSNVYRPRRPLLADVHGWTIGAGMPLRLVSGWTGEGGFYSNVSGFLPFSWSREPLEEFTVLEVRDRPRSAP